MEVIKLRKCREHGIQGSAGGLCGTKLASGERCEQPTSTVRVVLAEDVEVIVKDRVEQLEALREFCVAAMRFSTGNASVLSLHRAAIEIERSGQWPAEWS